jgi:putative SOS response-associated peptidase YedK
VCGRFNVDADPLSQLLLELVRLRHPGPDNHNAAPTETITVLRLDDEGRPELVPMRWWLTPHWAKKPETRYSMFNARSETVEKSPAFREPFRRHRCVVPISGFYEWMRTTTPKQPYYIHPHDAPGMLLAGIWDHWQDGGSGEGLDSFAVLTAPAHPGLGFVHDRQPVMLSIPQARRWLDADADLDELKALLGPTVPVTLDVEPVSTWVNNARHKDARCVEPIGDAVLVEADPSPAPAP